MSLTWLEIKTKMQPYVLRHIDKEAAEWIYDSELADICNYVANAINEECHVNQERYYRKTVSGQNYYEMNGDIIKIKILKYEDPEFQTQKYAVVPVAYAAGGDNEGEYYSVIVFKNTPTSSEVQLDILYLRRCHNINSDADTDTLDLPDKLIPDFLELLKTKIRIDFGDADPLIFDRDLAVRSRSIAGKLDTPQIKDGRVRNYWGGLDKYDDHLYDITDKKLSTDEVYTDVDGAYYWYE